MGRGETGAGGGGRDPASDIKEVAEAARGGGRRPRQPSSGGGIPKSFSRSSVRLGNNEYGKLEQL